MDDYEQGARLVSLAYEVFRDMRTPGDKATGRAMRSGLSRAFFDKATALANFEAAAPRAHRPTLPLSMYSIAEVGTSALGGVAH